MLNRPDRKAVLDLIDGYSLDAVSSSDFDEALQAIGDRTNDETVRDVVNWLWGCYDDLRDHKIVASKSEWDLIQRLRLLVESDGEVHYESERRLTWRQPIAWACLTACPLMVVVLGWGWWPATLLSALTSMPLGYFGMLERAAREQPELWPFSSVREISRVCRSVPGFRKRKYRRELARRQIRSAFFWAIMCIPGLLLWVTFSPIVILFQSIPEDVRTPRVVLAA